MYNIDLDIQNIFTKSIMEKYPAIFDCLSEKEFLINEDNLKHIHLILKKYIPSKRINSFIAETAIIEEGVYIGNNCKIHDYALIRRGSILLDNCIVGHCSEVISSIVFDESNITHKVSVGNCIIGSGVNLGANVVAANISLFNSNIRVPDKSIKTKMLNGEVRDTMCTKTGSIIGCNTRVGMNSSISPGTILSQNNIVYPNLHIGGREFQKNLVIKNSIELTFENLD